MQTEHKLTKNQSLVFETLNQAHTPLTAYTILDKLRDEGFRAPPQVYRALEKLQDIGLIHRLDSLNAFVACTHSHCQDHDLTAFAICEKCEQVTEMADQDFNEQLLQMAKKQNFAPTKTSIEIYGTCGNCLGEEKTT